MKLFVADNMCSVRNKHSPASRKPAQTIQRYLGFVLQGNLEFEGSNQNFKLNKKNSLWYPAVQRVGQVHVHVDFPWCNLTMKDCCTTVHTSNPISIFIADKHTMTMMTKRILVEENEFLFLNLQILQRCQGHLVRIHFAILKFFCMYRLDPILEK